MRHGRHDWLLEPPAVLDPATRPAPSLESPTPGFDLERTLEDLEYRYIQMALERTGGVQTAAAELLGISFRQFRYKLQKHSTRAAAPRAAEPRPADP